MRLLTTLGFVSLAGCAASQDREVGGWTAVENESAARIRFHGDGELDSRGPGWVSVECPGNQTVTIDTVVESGVLHIRSHDEAGASACVVLVPVVTLRHIRVTGRGDVESDATFPELESIEVTGKGSVALGGVSSPSLDVWVRGSGEVDLEWLESDSASFDLSGTGDVHAAGAVEEGLLWISGTGDFWGADLVFTHLVAEVSGSGNAEVNVSGSAELTLSGSGSVLVSGGGLIDADVTGNGSMELAN